MAPIRDDELILHHYRDGLDAVRLAEIDAALAASAELRARRAALLDVLASADEARVPEAPAGFERRVWRTVQARIAPQRERTSARAWWSIGFVPRAAFAAACALAVALGIGFYVGRHSADEARQASAEILQARVLDAYVAEHLRATEGLLLTAVNSDAGDAIGSNREVAAALIDSNRLYALAARRAGNARLADFLRQLEPVLLELANQPASADIQSTEGLRDYVRKTDLLFQVRAVESKLDAGKRRTDIQRSDT